MSLIVTADLHLTDNPRDEHRWGLLPWLAKQAQLHGSAGVLLLGDLTDAKDKHSAALTNRMVQGLRELAEVVPVYIIKGNHDYIDENTPFFNFVDTVATGVRFMVKPTTVNIRGMGNCLFLPHTRNHVKDWSEYGWEWRGSAAPRYIFCHQTFDGCLTETGFRMEGIPPSFFNRFEGKVFSGDIHKPQKVGRNIEYVGAPYRCRFGDDYVPRVLMIGTTPKGEHQQQDLHYPCKTKVVVDLHPASVADVKRRWNKEVEQAHDLREGDQLKVRVHLTRALFPEWPAIKAAVVALACGLELTGPELVAEAQAPTPKGASPATAAGAGGHLAPEGYVAAYASQKGASAALLAAGKGLLKRVTGGK